MESDVQYAISHSAIHALMAAIEKRLGISVETSKDRLFKRVISALHPSSPMDFENALEGVDLPGKATLDYKALLRYYDLLIHIEEGAEYPEFEVERFSNQHNLWIERDELKLLPILAAKAWEALESPDLGTALFGFTVLAVLFRCTDHYATAEWEGFDAIVDVYQCLDPGNGERSGAQNVLPPKPGHIARYNGVDEGFLAVTDEWVRRLGLSYIPSMLSFYTNGDCVYERASSILGLQRVIPLTGLVESMNSDFKIGERLVVPTYEASEFLLNAAKEGVDDPIAYFEAITRGAIIDFTGTQDRTPLQWAAQNCSNPEVLQVLLVAKADLEAVDDMGYTALHCAAGFNDNAQIVKVLLDGGANTEARDLMFEATPLMAAVAYQGSKALPIIEHLLAAGADLEARSREGMTPLLFAAANTDSVKVMELLLAKGADLRAKDSAGRGILEIAKNDPVADNSEVRSFLAARLGA